MTLPHHQQTQTPEANFSLASLLAKPTTLVSQLPVELNYLTSPRFETNNMRVCEIFISLSLDNTYTVTHEYIRKHYQYGRIHLLSCKLTSQQATSYYCCGYVLRSVNEALSDWLTHSLSCAHRAKSITVQGVKPENKTSYILLWTKVY